jgi:hypothetical protein
LTEPQSFQLRLHHVAVAIVAVAAAVALILNYYLW